MAMDARTERFVDDLFADRDAIDRQELVARVRDADLPDDVKREVQGFGGGTYDRAGLLAKLREAAGRKVMAR